MPLVLLRRARRAIVVLVAALASSVPAAADPNGTWSIASPPSARHSSAAIAAGDRMYVFGGYDEHERGDLWAFALDGSSRWSRHLAPASPAPFARFGHTAVHDPLAERMLLFSHGHTWALELADTLAWTQVLATGSALAVTEHAAVFDPVRNRMLVFGGAVDDTVLHSTVWSLSFAGAPAWSVLVPEGAGPSPRRGHVAVYDPVRDRVLLFGGDDGDSTRSDLWELSLGASPQWTLLAPAGPGPSPRSDHVAVYDAANDRLVVHGGWLGETLRDDAWTLSLDGAPAWTALPPSGSGPGGRARHAGVYDAPRGRLVVFGGSEPGDENDVHALELDASPAWTRLSDLGSPPPRGLHGLVYDSARDRMLIFGGNDGGFENDVRALRLGPGTWTRLTVSGDPPIGRWTPEVVYDARLDRLVIFGGLASGGNDLNDVAALDLASSVWTPLTPADGAPPAFSRHGSAYDARRHRLVVVGLYGGSQEFLGVWALDLTPPERWHHLVTVGPQPRSGSIPEVAYDPVGDRLIVYQVVDVDAGLADLLALTLSGTPTWSTLAPAGIPPIVRHRPSLVYDPVRHRMLLHAGVIGGSGNPLVLQTSALDLGTLTWLELQPGGTLPNGRFNQAAIYDPLRDRLLVSGGDARDNQHDTWALAFGTPERALVTCPTTTTWPTDTTLALSYRLSHGRGSARAVAWTLASERNWPGFPRHGIAIVDGDDTLEVQAPYPDSAAAGNRLRLTVALVGADGLDDSCVVRLLDRTTSTLASMVAASVEGGCARIQWHVPEPAPVVVERRQGGGAWSALAVREPDGRGLVAVEDCAVVAGERYGYRLRWSAPSPHAGAVAGETWVDVPSTAALALHGVRPNPSPAGERAVAFTLPRRGRVTLECFDLAGRRAGGRVELELGAGFHRVPVPAWNRLAPGVYRLRLALDGERREAPAVFVR